MLPNEVVVKLLKTHFNFLMQRNDMSTPRAREKWVRHVMAHPPYYRIIQPFCSQAYTAAVCKVKPAIVDAMLHCACVKGGARFLYATNVTETALLSQLEAPFRDVVKRMRSAEQNNKPPWWRK